MNSWPLLSGIVLTPFLFGTLTLFLPEEAKQWPRRLAMASSLLTAALSALLVAWTNLTSTQFQWREDIAVVPSWGIRYTLAVDGLSVAMVVLTAVVIFCGVLVSWRVSERPKWFFANLLFLVGGVFGVFVSFNLFFFFLFYEIAVLPMYLLILLWGSTNREYAAMKLTLYLLAGSALLILCFLALYTLPGSATFDFETLRAIATSLPVEKQTLLFALVFFGFGVLAACFPFHVWSPDGHVAAPTAASMLHAGVLMKLGSYGILRFGMELFPQGVASLSVLTGSLALINILYGALVASRQKDLKFMIGFSSVSHMGIVLLGLSIPDEAAVNGAVFQMFSHGIMTALFFACIGFLYDQTHSRQMDDYGGLARRAPVLSVLFIFAGLAGLGLPGTSGFVGEFLVLFGAVRTSPWIGIPAVTGLFFTAYYLLSAFQKTFFGPAGRLTSGVSDLKVGDLLPRGILVFWILLLGLYPSFFLDWFRPVTASYFAKGGV